MTNTIENRALACTQQCTLLNTHFKLVNNILFAFYIYFFIYIITVSLLHHAFHFFFKLLKLRCYFLSVFYQLHSFKETLTKIANISRPQYHLPQQGGVKNNKYKIEMHVRWKKKTKKKSSGLKNGLTILGQAADENLRATPEFG